MKRYTYYIYLIQGIKIGCTTDLQKRMADQGFTEWEILWQAEGDYDFGWIAGEKEIELQKLYGYRVDTINYQVSRMNRPKFDGSQRTYILTSEDRSKGGKTNVESGHLDRVRNPSKGGIQSAKSPLSNLKIENVCPRCNRLIKGPSYFRHINKCNLKA